MNEGRGIWDEGGMRACELTPRPLPSAGQWCRGAQSRRRQCKEVMYVAKLATRTPAWLYSHDAMQLGKTM